ncbi:MAG: 4-alpha-glucanotransferase [Candidatus Omnitrophica bacterium]|nr:4-alpha-glucanotransferase [Candidatus Omnitrophota bacterium]
MPNMRRFKRHTIIDKFILVAIVCLFLFSGVSYGLAPAPGTQSFLIRWESKLLYMSRTGSLGFAGSEEDNLRLHQNDAQVLLLSPEGRILADNSLRNDVAGLIRAVVYEEVRAVIQIMAEEDPSGYSLLAKAVSPANESLTDHIIAKSVELITARDNGLLSGALTEEEARLLAIVEPIIKSNAHGRFTRLFWDDAARADRIKLAIANGIHFDAAPAEGLPAWETRTTPSPLRKVDPHTWYYHKRLVTYQVPVFAVATDQGIGKLLNLPALAKKKRAELGVNAFMLNPIHPTIDKEHSPYAFVSGYAINELYIDWLVEASRFFPELAADEDILALRQPELANADFVKYEILEPIERKAAEKVYRTFLKDRKSGPVRRLAEEFERFKKSPDMSWLESYADFRALHDIYDSERCRKTIWMEWDDDDRIRSGARYGELKELYKFMQFRAYSHWFEARRGCEDSGVALFYDHPWYCGRDSVDVRDNQRYFRVLENPGVHTSTGTQQWDCLVRHNYTELSRSGYEPFLKFHRYKMDVLGFAGGRIDAGHMAYNWMSERYRFLQNGDEPGDALLLAIKREFDIRNAFVVVENLGAAMWVKDRIQALGLKTMMVLRWPDSPVPENTMAFLTTHDLPRPLVGYPQFYQDRGRDSDAHKELFNWLANCGARDICIAAGDEYGDWHRINDPGLSAEQRMDLCWRYILPRDSSPRMQYKDLPSHINWLSKNFTGYNWEHVDAKAALVKGREDAAKMVKELRAVSKETLDDLAQDTDFDLKYDEGYRSLVPGAHGKRMDIFRKIINRISESGETGTYTMWHHAIMGDFFDYSRGLLMSIRGLTVSRAPEVWGYIRELEDNIRSNINREEANFVLLGFMAEVLEGAALRSPMNGADIPRDGFSATVADLDRKAACYESRGQSLILYADDLLENAVIVDLGNTLKNILAKHNILEGGRIILFARNGANAKIMRGLISAAAPAIEVIDITPDQLQAGNDEVKEAEALLRRARAKGAGEVLALIRGPAAEYDGLASFAKSASLPIILIGKDHGPYSFALAIALALEAKFRDAPLGWLISLSRIESDDAGSLYERYRLSLRSLISA